MHMKNIKKIIKEINRIYKLKEKIMNIFTNIFKRILKVTKLKIIKKLLKIKT